MFPRCSALQGCGYSGDRELSSSLTRGKARGCRWKSCSQGLAPGWGTAQAAPSTEPRSQQPPACHSLTEAREASPTRCHKVCLLHKAKVRLRHSQLPRLAQPQAHHQEGWGSHSWQTLQCHYRSWDLHFDPHQVTTNKSNLLTQQLPQLLNYWNKHQTHKLSSLHYSAVGFAACRDLLWYKLLLFITHSLGIQQSVTIIPDYNV